LLVLAALASGDSRNQVFSDFVTPLPLPEGDTLVLGIVGGWERWDNPVRVIRRIALNVRDRNLPGVHVETVENHKLYLAGELLRKAFPHPRQARLILFGQSLGGRAALRLCRTLNEQTMPVRRVIVIDAYGNDPYTVPPNVTEAANLFQRDYFPVRGAPSITAEDSARTRIIENTQYFYRGKDIPMPDEFWKNRAFMGAHLKMEYDPQVWAHVERLIVEAATTIPATGR
jgi:pimeloyl-ACP methyl ester carboxylesterase